MGAAGGARQRTMPPLHAAAKRGDLAEVQRLLQSGATILGKDKEGWTCLHYASLYGHLDVVKVLLKEGGAELLMAKTKDGDTCLHLASQNGHLDVVKVLLDEGGAELLMVKANDGHTCLHSASQNGHLDVVKVLLKEGGPELLMAKDTDGWTCLHFASQNGHLGVVKVLLEKGGGLGGRGAELLMAKTNGGWTCLHSASHKGHLDVVKVLLKEGGAELLMQKANGGLTCLHDACRNGHLDVVNVLLEEGGPELLMVKANDGKTALEWVEGGSFGLENFLAQAMDMPHVREYMEVEKVRCALEKAAKEDGEPCLIPMGLVSTWTDNFAKSRLVGKGAFGEVYEGIISSFTQGGEGRVVAVKRLSSDMLLKGGEKQMRREINVLHQFKHPNIIRLLGYTAASDGGCIVYEMGSRRSLAHNLLDKDLAEALTWKFRVRVAHGLSRALNYLHCNDPSAPALHRDVKSANVVLCADFTPKLIDCGLALYSGFGLLSSGTVASTAQGAAVGTPGYMCPRYARGGVPFDVKCEVFAFGVVLLELITGKVQVIGPSDLYTQHVDDEEEIIPDARAGTWLDSCLESLKNLAFECLAKYGKRIDPMMLVMRRLRRMENAHCRQTEEEARQARELVRLQSEKDAGRADGVFAEQLRKKLHEQEKELLRLRNEELLLAAARAEEAKKTEKEKRECCVCFDRRSCTEGISCEAGLHFHCNGCFSAEVTEQCAPENIGAFKHAEMRLRCRACLPNKAYFDNGSVPAHLDGESFTAYVRARENVQVGEAMQDQEQRYAKQVQELQAQLEAALQLANDHKSAAVRRHRMHIVENILTLKCPKDTCKAAFVDFDGCCALTCNRCGCGFCAYCLADCGRDAHRHVANCRYNTAPGRDVFAPKNAVDMVKKARITRLVRDYLAREVEEGVRRDLVGAMDRDFGDLGIAGSDVLA